jgi:hypothetical protein
MDRSPVEPYSFVELTRRWPDLPPHGRALIFDCLSGIAQAVCWAECRRRADLKVEGELLYEERLEQEWPPPKRRRPSHGTPMSTSTASGVAKFGDDDPLKRIPAAEYLPALTGKLVSASGRTRCPMRDHPDEHPSAKTYGTRWVCFSCGARGGIIEAAAEAYGLEPRGADFLRLRDRTVHALLYAPLKSEERR